MGIEDSDLLDIDLGDGSGQPQNGEQPPSPQEQALTLINNIATTLQAVNEQQATLEDTLTEIQQAQADTSQAVAALAESRGADVQIDDPSTFPFPLIAIVPPATSEVEPITASFDAPYDGTITKVIPRFPAGVQDAAGVGLYDSDDNQLIPRGGQFNFPDGSGDRDTGTPSRLTGDDSTLPAIPLNVDVPEGNTITAKFSNTDQSENHLVALILYFKEVS